MSETQDYDYSEPWPMYSDEDEPWKDFDRLLKLEEKMETQMEIGAALGCTPSTISYWMKKARVEVNPEYDQEDLQCEFFEVCDNLVPGPKNVVCDVCLGVMRHNASEDELDPADSDDLESHMVLLYEEYSDFIDNRQDRYDEYQDLVSDDGEDSTEES